MIVVVKTIFLHELCQKTYYKAHKCACAYKQALLSVNTAEKLDCLQADFLGNKSIFYERVFS
jgi:hypothetical protein